ncbi:CBL-interacting serine/threonine-protein kinase 4 [Raphanus sativus]|uniref:non-specific serine/threonine protein kinase n=1 Tax=Raphanus sativus TaxID=3726 RepID=A0A6J0M2K2_RAPSA|nr:CBL-interacting serine/threonine-protein kinase 4 [Raphanus sativus]KAJ4912263.1 CBL-interacting serine/threonine-protein kinase 4 [Raphanus sativus]
MGFPSPPSREKPPVTILLGKYELGRRLGSGSFAKVHVARSIETDELAAVKIIDKKKTADAGMEPRIIREIEAMRRLHHHPNVLRIHEVMATKTKIYLVVELAAGGELYARIRRLGRLRESEARRYFQQLASALAFCHREGIAHRDVKPQNLLLDRDGNLKVSDFGLSALPEHRSSEGMLHTSCGTPAYTAPEVLAQKSYDGAKADSWSCGVFLFVLLAGYVPFEDSNVVTMYRKIQRRDYKFPNWISKPARSVIYKLLDPNPETRMSMEAVTDTKWFKKSVETTPQFQPSVLESDDRLGKLRGHTITAFDLISLSAGLDLSGLFERRKRKETRFTSKVSVEEVVEKAKAIGEKLGCRVEKKKDEMVVGLGKGRTTVVVEAVELVEGLVVAEMKVVEGVEEEEEQEESYWSELVVEFEEIVLSWHGICES